MPLDPPCSQPSPSVTVQWILSNILCWIRSFVNGLVDGEIVVKTSPSGQERATSFASLGVGDDGSVAAGAKYVNFIFSPDFVGTVQSVAFAGATDAQVDLTAPPGDTLDAISYTITAGGLRIITIA